MLQAQAQDRCRSQRYGSITQPPDLVGSRYRLLLPVLRPFETLCCLSVGHLVSV